MFCYWSASDTHRFNSRLPSHQLYCYKFFLGGIESGSFANIQDYWEGYGKAIIMQRGDFENIEVSPVLSSTIQMLKIYNCSLGEAVPFLRDATELTRLVICDCKGLGYLSLPPHESSSLKSLILRSLPDLRSLSTYSQLKELEISYCQRVKVVFPSMSVCLPYLEEILVWDCEEVAEIFESGRKFVALPKLRKLRMENLPKLGSIFSMQLYLCTSLEKLYIKYCPMLEGIFTSTFGDMISEEVTSKINVTDPYGIVVLPNLKCMTLIDLPKLGSIYSKPENIVAFNTGDTKSTIDLPSLENLWLNGLPNLSSISSMRLYLCTSLKDITVEDCPKLDGIFISPLGDTISQEVKNRTNVRDPYDTVVLPNLNNLTLRDLPKLSSIYSKHENIIALPTGDTKPIFDLPSLESLWLRGLPELSSIYSMRLYLSTSVESIRIEDCPKLEGIFISPIDDVQNILVLRRLCHLDLRRLPSLSSIYKGLLMCSSMGTGCTSPTRQECPQLKWLPLSKKLICDVSPSTVASFPTEHENPEWWKPLLRDVPKDASRLSDFINQARRSSLISQSYNNDDHQHLETNSQASPSASTFLPFEPEGLVLMPASHRSLVLHNNDNDADDKTTWGRELSLRSS